MANNYKNSKVDLTTTNITTLYTAPSATQTVVKSILVSNDSGSDDTVTLTITDSATAATANRLHVVASYLEIT